ncbi:MAG: sodium-dependent transporter [Deltaproteobacteria bacterium]|nr:sodium-dependent transporter [Deltaproteobacteria bacterium]
MKAPSKPREVWATRVGLILAVAGNAIGLGNFLRFPVQCAQNGGGAFMIPYFIALFLLGIPLMWCEWAMGRIGGRHHCGTTPGIFHVLWKHPVSKYLGSLGIFIPTVVAIYYVYIESWTLAYAVFSVTGKYFGIMTREGMGEFLASYQGQYPSAHFKNIVPALLFYLFILFINVQILSRGIVKGIEWLAKWAMPTLFIFAIAMVVRVFTLGAPDPTHPEMSVLHGFGFMWNPDFSKLTQSQVWLASAGQIFFTLSLGFGAIQTFASYVKKDEDIALNGLTTSVTNEFAEVVCGGSIAIPVAVAFFGVVATTAIAKAGAFDLGFQAMPIIFQKMPLGQLFGGIWFFLLFLAAMTSSVAIVQPLMAFLQEEFQIGQKKAAWACGGVLLAFGLPVIFFLKYGFLNEFDFWAGTFGVVAFAVIEIIVFFWIFGSKKAWEEIISGADIRIPKIFYYILKYVTPLYLIILLVTWFFQNGLDVLLLKGVSETNVPYVITARVVLTGLLAVILLMIRQVFRREHRIL